MKIKIESTNESIEIDNEIWNKYLIDETFKEKSYISLRNTFDIKEKNNIYLIIKKVKQENMYEPPRKLEFSIVNIENGNTLQIPSISYGIRSENGELYCDLYSINPNQENEDQIPMEEILNSIKSEFTETDEKYIPSLEAFALKIFITLLDSNNIENINYIGSLEKKLGDILKNRQDNELFKRLKNCIYRIHNSPNSTRKR